MPNNTLYITVLEKIADIMDFKGENVFKVSAFRNAASVLEGLTGEIDGLYKSGELAAVKGIGKGILAVVEEIYTTGESATLKTLSEDVPDTVFDLFSLRGLGSKKIQALYHDKGVVSIEGLEESLSSGMLDDVKGFSAGFKDKLREEISRFRKNSLYIRADKAEDRGAQILNDFKNFCVKISETGQLRRKTEIVSCLEFVALGMDDISDELKTDYNLQIAEDHISGLISGKFPVKIYTTTDETEFVRILIRTTGSSSFLEKAGSGNIEKAATEEEYFTLTGMDYVIPEMREEEYFDAALQFRRNSGLSAGQFKGFFHFHTNYSDGVNTLEEMVSYCINEGYNHFAVCDHSKTAAYAGGMNEEKVMRQRDEIQKVSQKLGVKILSGVESDILPDGSLDYDQDFLSTFNLVVASVHSSFNLSEGEMTARIIKAVENPCTDILGHPTGRLLLRRDSYKVDIIKVIDACAANNVAIEINASPYRLDLDWRNIYYAREKGCIIAINPDAHSLGDIRKTKYGINVARKAGLQPEEVLNCFAFDDLVNYLNRKIKKV